MKKVYLVSALLAVVVAVSVYLFTNSLEQKAKAPAQAATKNVVVTTVQIPTNTQITEDMVQLTALPVQAVNAYALTDVSQAVGMITKCELVAGEQLLPQRIVKKGQEEGSLSNILEDGKRAISLGVDEVSGVSGYIQKGDYVDVIATLLNKNETGESVPVSTALVENLLVLEVGVKSAADDAKAGSYSTITLCATPDEAVKINYAASNGKLRLLLRAVLDNKTANPQSYPN